MITADLRIDNRDELLGHLSLKPQPGRRLATAFFRCCAGLSRSPYGTAAKDR
jgi:hypothetical protein